MNIWSVVATILIATGPIEEEIQDIGPDYLPLPVLGVEESVEAVHADFQEVPKTHVEELIENEEVQVLIEQVQIAAEKLVYESVAYETGKVLAEQTLQREEACEAFPRIEDLTYLVASEEAPAAKETLEQNAYNALPISRADQANINDLLNTMAENNVFQLLFQKKRLQKIGSEIDHVHPICFIGAVFSDRRLTWCMHEIYKSNFKWKSFVDGFGKRLKHEVRKGNVEDFIPGFAEHLNLPSDKVEYYIRRGDFEGLVLFIMNQRY